MSSTKHGQPPGKPPATSGISPAELLQRIEALEALVRERFDEMNLWNSRVRDWIGKKVDIQLVNNESVTGILRWVDRYTLCVDEADMPDTEPEPAIVHKGAIAVIRLD